MLRGGDAAKGRRGDPCAGLRASFTRSGGTEVPRGLKPNALSFPISGMLHKQFVGQTTWSARVPLDPLFRSKNQRLSTIATGRRGRRPRSRGTVQETAPRLMQVLGYGKSMRHYALACSGELQFAVPSRDATAHTRRHRRFPCFPNRGHEACGRFVVCGINTTPGETIGGEKSLYG
jgi:hypothetical protein